MSAAINREVVLNCIQCNLSGRKVVATDGTFCKSHARVGSEFRREAKEVFANWIDPKRPTG